MADIFTQLVERLDVLELPEFEFEKKYDALKKKWDSGQSKPPWTAWTVDMAKAECAALHDRNSVLAALHLITRASDPPPVGGDQEESAVTFLQPLISLLIRRWFELTGDDIHGSWDPWTLILDCKSLSDGWVWHLWCTFLQRSAAPELLKLALLATHPKLDPLLQSVCGEDEWHRATATASGIAVFQLSVLWRDSIIASSLQTPRSSRPTRTSSASSSAIREKPRDVV